VTGLEKPKWGPVIRFRGSGSGHEVAMPRKNVLYLSNE